MAWPIVWPKFRVFRMPFSRSSSATIVALSSTLRRTSHSATSSPGPPSRTIAAMFEAIHAKSAGLAITACLMASASPFRTCSIGRVWSVPGSMRTRAGWWNAPTRFFPARVSTPVFPPIEASSMASRVVGTTTSGTPRMKVAATNPPRSPTMPPPSAKTTESRPNPESIMSSVRRDHCARVLLSSPAGTVKTIGSCAPVR